jgi:hypothetical protein
MTGNNISRGSLTRTGRSSASSPRIAIDQVGYTELHNSAVSWPLVHTYSIVAREAETGQLGVAAEPHYTKLRPAMKKLTYDVLYSERPTVVGHHNQVIRRIENLAPWGSSFRVVGGQSRTSEHS